MEVTVAVSVILLGLALGPIARWLERREARQLAMEWARSRSPAMGAVVAGVPSPPPQPNPKGDRVLIGFAVFVGVFAVITLVRIWPSVRISEQALYFWGWLFLTMVFGMFVQVLTTNYRSGQRLFAVEASQLLFPLLFSIVVFYPIWGIGASGPKDFFSFYAAFLNGFYWETIVSAAKP